MEVDLVVYRLLPTKIIGASGQWCLISGYHFEVTFSKDDGLYINAKEKYIILLQICKNFKRSLAVT